MKIIFVYALPGAFTIFDHLLLLSALTAIRLYNFAKSSILSILLQTAAAVCPPAAAMDTW